MMLLIQLFLAHIIGDFFLQWTSWVQDKEAKKWRSPYLYLHGLIHFLLIMVIVRSTGFWGPAALIALSHLVIDLLKVVLQKKATKRGWFFIDQALHLVVLLSVWGYWNNMTLDYDFLGNIKILVLVTATLTLLHPASYFIKIVISKWSPKDDDGTGRAAESLQHAGRLIGFLERIMILVFILLGKWEGVGFLLAAKSVFRFGDLKNSKETQLTEYVLIGTLLSFGIAILTGTAALKLLEI